MRFWQTYRNVIAYGLLLGLLVFLLKWLEARFIFTDHRLEWFAGAIAILFTGLGIWLALKLVKPKVHTVVVEKEVLVPQTNPPVVDPKAIEACQLSPRELDVLGLMARGLSNEEIAEQLFVSINTVKTHSSNIYVKLDVKRRTQAVEKAKRLNIIT